MLGIHPYQSPDIRHIVIAGGANFGTNPGSNPSLARHSGTRLGTSTRIRNFAGHHSIVPDEERSTRSLPGAGGQNLAQVLPGNSGDRDGVSPRRRVVLQNEEV